MNEKYKIQRQQLINRVTIIGAVLNLILTAIKIVIGALFNSHALIVDGFHSLSDLATDLLVIIATRLAGKRPDRDHHYGHQRYETFAVILLGGFLIAVGGALIFECLTRLIDPIPPVAPGYPVLIGAVISIVAKEWLFFYTHNHGKKINSQLLIANAWHHRSDSLSSIVVLVGASASMAGYPRFDALAAITVAVLIGWIGCKLIWQKMKELTESSPIPDELESIQKLILETGEVSGIHELRCRRLGSDIFMDLHLEVTPNITVSEGHQISNWVTTRIMKHYNEIKDVIVHVDYELDCTNSPDTTDALLPLRNEIMDELKPHLQQHEDFAALIHTNLHYLQNGINIELFMPLDTMCNRTYHQRAMDQLLQQKPYIKAVQLWYG